MLNPEAGDVIPGTGGLRKLRFADERRGKGKRGGLRVIYYWWDPGSQFWLFTIYDKDETKGAYPAVHSRHFGIFGQPLVAQYQGYCEAKG